MKKLICTTVLMLGFIAPMSHRCATITFAAEKEKGLVGYWKFDENKGESAKDSSGQGNNGNLIGGAKWAEGISGSCIKLNGEDGYIEVQDNESLNPEEELTVEAWVKIPSQGRDCGLLEKGNYYCWLGAGGTLSLALILGGTFQTEYSASVLNDDKWHHWAGVYDGESIKIYVDGKFDIKKMGISGSVPSTSANLTIGFKSLPGVRQYFPGFIDELKIYNRALKPDEVKEHYQKYKTGTDIVPVKAVISKEKLPSKIKEKRIETEKIYDPVFSELKEEIMPAEKMGWDAMVKYMPKLVLRDEYRPICRRPCEYIGFAFGSTVQDFPRMKEMGVNVVADNLHWVMRQDENAPYGCGIEPPPSKIRRLGQTFKSKESFDGFTPCLPTWLSKDSGCRWNLYCVTEEQLKSRLIASGTWQNVEDNSCQEATFTQQSPGKYYFEISEPFGSAIGWYAKSDALYPDGAAYIDEKCLGESDFEFRLRIKGEWHDIVKGGGSHYAILLGPSIFQNLQKFGIFTSIEIGNYNNPGFSSYPRWFYEKFPDVTRIDENGMSILGNMFGDTTIGAPSIEHPAIVSGTTRFIHATAAALSDEPSILFWVMGGESGYWTDYSSNAIKHFREWLRTYRYSNIKELNKAWKTKFNTFEEIEPPKFQNISQRWMDWMDFRFNSLGERVGWHYQAVRSQDPIRLLLSCNHGWPSSVFAYTGLAARPEIYSAMTDGFETGQIMSDFDIELFNIFYMEALNSLGKPYAPRRLAYKKSDPMARGGGKSYTPEAARRYVYESLGGDAWYLGLIDWSGTLPDGEWGIKGTPAETEIARIFGEVRQLWPILDDMHAVKPKLGVFISHQTWTLRGFLQEWKEFHAESVRNQVPKLYIYDGQVLSGEAEGFSVIVSINNEFVPDDVLAGLVSYIRRGGKLLIVGKLGGQTLTGNPQSVPQELQGKGVKQIGKGQVAFLADAESNKILQALGESVQLVKIKSKEKVFQRSEIGLAIDCYDWPQDLYGHISLGQTSVLPKGSLNKVAIHMPTYLKKPEVGFTFQVREDGPDGKIIAKKDIPGGIADNAWVEIEVSSPTKAGQKIYIEALPDSALKEWHLGWWSTKGDVYEGEAYVDGVYVDGDRQVKLIFEELTYGEQVVETFLLSDGLNFGLVLINIGEGEIILETALQKILSHSSLGQAYEIICPLSPSSWEGKGVAGNLKLQGHGSAFLYIKHKTTKEEAQKLLSDAENRVKIWKSPNAVTPFTTYAIGRAESFLKEGRYEKVTALALNVLKQIGMSVEGEQQKIPASGNIQLTLRLYDGEGKLVDADRVLAEFTPTPMYWRMPEKVSPGIYRLSLPVSELPKQYDYEARRYVNFRGPLRIRLAAKAGGFSATRLVDLAVE